MTRAPAGLPPRRHAYATPENIMPHKFANCLAGPDLGHHRRTTLWREWSAVQCVRGETGGGATGIGCVPAMVAATHAVPCNRWIYRALRTIRPLAYPPCSCLSPLLLSLQHGLMFLGLQFVFVTAPLDHSGFAVLPHFYALYAGLLDRGCPIVSHTPTTKGPQTPQQQQTCTYSSSGIFAGCFRGHDTRYWSEHITKLNMGRANCASPRDGLYKYRECVC